ncbi:MAG: hypothetical protein A2Z04_03585 [Chloroflexi bacterium RBG_16_57_9]|nr:MAG: hypothetical protein A2Z04_03585 [Chloroflexi bacterium RBG_16_57_9]
MLTLDELIERLSTLMPIFDRDQRIIAIYLFGSHIDGYATPGSDVDLGIVFAEDIPLDDELAIAMDIDAALSGIRVDVVNMNRARLPLRHRILRMGILLFERHPDRVADFIEDTILRYIDFAPDLEAYNREFDRAMAEVYGVRRR